MYDEVMELPPRGILEFYQQLWGQALVAMTNAEEEVTRLLKKLEERAGWHQDEALRQARTFSERLISQRRDMERRLEEAVRSTVAHIQVPRREDVTGLSTRIEGLAKRVEGLEP